jgi:U4/U6 small nuclear ribonucleoprotein PRP4
MELVIGENLHSNRICDLAFVSSDTLVSVSADQSVCLWNVETSAKARIEFDAIVHSVAIHPSSRILVTGLSDGTFAVLDIETQKTVLIMLSNDGLVPTVSCHPDGGVVYAGGLDHIGRMRDLRSIRALKVLQGHDDRLTCSRFDSGFHIVTGSADHSMICWDMRNLTRSKRISGHLAVVSSIDIQGDLLLSASLDLSLKVWSMLDFRTYLTIKDCPSPVVGVGFAASGTPDRPFIVTASRDGSWRLYHDDVL